MRTQEEKRNYQREYMRRKKQMQVSSFCPCGKPAVRIVAVHEGICVDCQAIEQAIYFHPRKRDVKPDESPMEEAESRGTRYWKERLAFWLPNPQPGWGSLQWLDARLAEISHRGAEAQRV